MRISGGTARGIPLRAPPGRGVRPATDKLRQAIFSSLGGRVSGAWFLDLFAGSGAYGLEALSRGARGGTFVEKDAQAAACLRRNLSAVCKSMGRDEGGLTVLTGDAVTLADAGDKTPDLVFVDPPYELIAAIAPPLFARLAESLASKPDAIVIFEMPGEIELAPPGWTLLKRLGRGPRQPTAAFFKKS
jgi:16S rRNA (guanine966-N2)-methyltransferase